MAGGGGNQKTTQELPDELKPLASAYADRAMSVSNNPWQAYGGQRFAGFNPMQMQGFDMIQQQASQGSPLNDAASKYATNTLNGDYLNQSGAWGAGNPQLQSQIDAASGDVTRHYSNAVKPQIEAAGVNSGSFGNSGIQQMQAESQRGLAEELGQISSGMRFNDYNNQQNMAFQGFQNERGRQMQMAGMSPQIANQRYADAGQLMGAGQAQQNQQQQGLDFGFQQWQDQQNHPYKQLTALGAPLGVNMGGSTVTSGGGK